MKKLSPLHHNLFNYKKLQVWALITFLNGQFRWATANGNHDWVSVNKTLLKAFKSIKYCLSNQQRTETYPKFFGLSEVRVVVKTCKTASKSTCQTFSSTYSIHWPMLNTENFCHEREKPNLVIKASVFCMFLVIKKSAAQKIRKLL